jgi:hypothetical protein
MSSIFSFRRPSASTARKAPRSPGPGSRSRSGSPRHEVGLNSTALSVTRKEASLPQAPPYEEGSGDDWLKGSVYIDRTVTNIYNPSPSGWGSSELDERVTGELAGIALYNLRMYSDVVRIGNLGRCGSELFRSGPSALFCKLDSPSPPSHLPSHSSAFESCLAKPIRSLRLGITLKR